MALKSNITAPLVLIWVGESPLTPEPSSCPVGLPRCESAQERRPTSGTLANSTYNSRCTFPLEHWCIFKTCCYECIVVCYCHYSSRKWNSGFGYVTPGISGWKTKQKRKNTQNGKRVFCWDNHFILGIELFKQWWRRPTGYWSKGSRGKPKPSLLKTEKWVFFLLLRSWG